MYAEQFARRSAAVAQAPYDRPLALVPYFYMDMLTRHWFRIDSWARYRGGAVTGEGTYIIGVSFVERVAIVGSEEVIAFGRGMVEAEKAAGRVVRAIRRSADLAASVVVLRAVGDDSVAVTKVH